MNYLLIENETLVGVCDYEPNIGNDDIQIIKYSGNIPKERILYLDGKSLTVIILFISTENTSRIQRLLQIY